MSIENKSIFLLGLSSFWNRLFSDYDLLNAFYQGTEELLAQIYLDLMQSVLTPTIERTPVFNRENWKLVTIREDKLYRDNDFSGWVLNLSDEVDFEFLHNRIMDPTVSLERGTEYIIETIAEENQQDATYYLVLNDNPFVSGTNNGPIDGVALRNLYLDVPTVQASNTDGVLGIDPGDPDTTASSFTSFSTDPLVEFSLIDIGRYIVVNDYPTEVSYKIDSIIDVNHVELVDENGDVPVFTLRTGVSWRLETRNVARELAFWAPNTSIDAKTLRDNFGYLVNRFEASSDNYKSLIKGIFQYFLLGPSLQRIESALNVITGIPVASADDELLILFEEDVEVGFDRITTNLDEYLIPANFERADIADTANWGVLTFDAFESFTTIFDIVDDVSDPGWWWNVVIPPELMPDQSSFRRLVSPELRPFIAGDTYVESQYGDLGIFYGADDDGEVVPGGFARPPLRRNIAYQVLDKFLKYHTFGVFVDDAYVLPRTQEDLKNIIDAGKPSYTYMIFEAESNYEDGATVVDTLFDFTVGIGTGGALEEDLPRLNNLITVGSGMTFPSYYVYTAGGGITVTAGTGNPALGETQVILGGEDPSVIEAGITNCVADFPVQITVV